MYKIQTRPKTYYAGKMNDGSQTLMGLLYTSIGILIFDELGKLIDKREYLVIANRHNELEVDFDKVVEKEIHVIRKQMSIRNIPIQVLPFHVEDWDIELKQFPIDLEEYMQSPNNYSDEESDILVGQIDDWKTAGYCVLTWGNSYPLDSDGYTL